MTLKSGTSRATFEANLKAELAAGRTREQALAIAFAMQRRSKKKTTRKR